MVCPAVNTDDTVNSSQWRIEENLPIYFAGLGVAGLCTIMTFCITGFGVVRHAKNYTNPKEQRQIIRILFMPSVYSVISCLSLRFVQEFTYYSVVEVAYEAITLSAFLLLIIEYAASTTTTNTIGDAISQKEKQRLPLLFWWRYRPTKAYFIHLVKWSVLQYVIIRPLLTIIAIICEANGVLCEDAGFSPVHAKVYLDIADFISITIALYGLGLFYDLVKKELKGRKPLAKFLAIKLPVIFIFYQLILFAFLKGKVIQSSMYWSQTNIANGLGAFAIVVEMVFFSGLMLWAYPAHEYANKEASKTRIIPALLDSVNYSDFAREIYSSLKFYYGSTRGSPNYTTKTKGYNPDPFADAIHLTLPQPTYAPQSQPV